MREMITTIIIPNTAIQSIELKMPLPRMSLAIVTLHQTTAVIDLRATVMPHER
jgi:hypothetical protein